MNNDSYVPGMIYESENCEENQHSNEFLACASISVDSKLEKLSSNDVCELEDRDPINGQSKAKVFLAAQFNPHQPNFKNFPLTNGKKF